MDHPNNNVSASFLRRTITSLGGAEYGVLGNVPRQRLNFTWDVFG
jgi:hypothetical protein